MLLVIRIAFFYLAALINYETKDYKENHKISSSYINIELVKFQYQDLCQKYAKL